MHQKFDDVSKEMQYLTKRVKCPGSTTRLAGSGSNN
jgi:hypothetical protein